MKFVDDHPYLTTFLVLVGVSAAVSIVSPESTQPPKKMPPPGVMGLGNARQLARACSRSRAL